MDIKLLLGAGLLLLAAHSRAQELAPVAYQPDVVGVGRLFLVALNVDPAAPRIEITIPDTVELLDQTPLPTDKPLRKYYFRALKAAEKTDIVFAHPAGPVIVTIRIWSWDDLHEFRTLKGVQLPRRWPLGEKLPELKQGQVTTTSDLIADLRKRGPSGTQWLTVEDDQIWAMQPDSTIPRWHWTNVSEGCPVHGPKIYESKAFYPWGMDTILPYTWKIKCPVGGEVYPSNDFGNLDFTSGPFADDGIGGACDYNGNKYGFIAEMCQHYCRHMLSMPPQCADGYVATGDAAYLHKALVGMARIAVEYGYLATMTQHRHRNTQSQVERLGPAPFSEGPCLAHSGLTTYMIHYQGAALAEAYDKIWPDIERDPDIIPYLQAKGFDIRTHQDVRRFLEENLFAVCIQALMDGATHANPPVAQYGVARIAEVLNYERGDEFMDWLYYGDGNMYSFVTNGYFRDGAPYESTGGYNGIHVSDIGPVIECIEHMRQLRPQLYPESTYPRFTDSRRYRNIYDFSMNTVNIDRTYPRVGDQGAHPQYRKLPRITYQNGGSAAFEHAYRLLGDPKFAWALANDPRWMPSRTFGYTREQTEQAAAQWPDDWNDRSCLQDGYGLAMLRGGEGENKRALWLNYRRTSWHAQDEIMQIGLDAFQSEILGHMGYPRNWNHWYVNWITHLVARQFPYVQMTGRCELFADAGPVQVTEGYAEGFNHLQDGPQRYDVLADRWQRRLVALVDVSPNAFYCIDLYRNHGGDEQWWSFHCQEGDVTTEGLSLQRQETGTLAGPDVPYGDEKWLAEAGCSKGNYGWSGLKSGFAYLYNVQRDPEPNGVWSADWALKDADGLRFRMHVPAVDGAEVILCDGTCPAGGDPYEMKWLLMHRQGESPVMTQTATVMELYHGQPVIKSVRRLPVSGDDEAGFDPYGLVVELTNGRVDYIFVSADGAVARATPDGFEFTGRFGLYSELDGQMTNAVLVGGSRLAHNGIGVATAEAEYRGHITAVDWSRQAVTISPAPPDIAALVGRQVVISNPVRCVAIKVLAATRTEAGAELLLEFDPLIGTGRVTGTDGLRVLTSTDMPLYMYRYYHGARLVNAEGTREYRIAGTLNQKWVLIDTEQHPDLSAATVAGEFPTDTWFRIYDYGVGDEVSCLHVVSISRSGSGS